MRCALLALGALASICEAGAHPHDSIHRRKDHEREARGIVFVNADGERIPKPTWFTIPDIPAIPTIPPVPDPVIPTNIVPSAPPHPTSPAPSPNPNRDFGISYSPYNNDNTCKTQDEVNTDIDKLNKYGYVRIYGVDCNQTATVLHAARRNNMKLFAGVYDLQDFPNSLNKITDAAADDWSPFHTIAIGNEMVNQGTATPSQLVGAVHQARSILREAGYPGPVVTVEVFNIILQHPELCHASDFCAANCHAFFDANIHAPGAGKYVKQQYENIRRKVPNKRTVITESGWPHKGNANGVAVPSPRNQHEAIMSLRREFGGGDDLVLFTGFDDLWKENGPGTYGAEQFWGIQGGKWD